MKVYKYRMSFDDEVTVEMPQFATILDVQMQGGVPCVWALVNPEAVFDEERTFRIVGTGAEVPSVPWYRYIGTVQDGRFVWHVFEASAQMPKTRPRILEARRES